MPTTPRRSRLPRASASSASALSPRAAVAAKSRAIGSQLERAGRRRAARAVFEAALSWRMETPGAPVKRRRGTVIVVGTIAALAVFAYFAGRSMGTQERVAELVRTNKLIGKD